MQRLQVAVTGLRTIHVLRLTRTVTHTFTCTVTTSLGSQTMGTCNCHHVDGRQSPLNLGWTQSLTALYITSASIKRIGCGTSQVETSTYHFMMDIWFQDKGPFPETQKVSFLTFWVFLFFVIFHFMNKTQIPTYTNMELFPWFLFVMIRYLLRIRYNVKNWQQFRFIV